jgi:hypothetical protein
MKPALVVPDRVVALEAMMEAKGTAPPKPPVCHGYACCCHCPACLLRERQPPFRKELAAA